MLPILFSVGSFNFYTLGLTIGVSYLIAAFTVWRRLRELNLKEEKVIDFIIVSSIFSWLTARIFYIIPNWEEFRHFVVGWFDFMRFPGFSYFGTVIGLVIISAWYAKKQKWDYWQILDEVSYGVLPFMIFVQLGCFFDGSGQGKPTTMPWGVFFPGSLVRRQPLPVFSAIALFLIWILLLKIEREWRFWDWYKSKAQGIILLIFLSLFFAANIPLAFFKDSKIYFLLLDLIINVSGLLIVGAVFYSRSGRKIISHDRK
jgi:phosphatidylglycerol:prolipoprotein diacylglycerol transferase